MAGNVSTRQPSTSSSRLAISRKLIGPTLIRVIRSAKCAAVPSATKMYDSPDEIAIT